MKILKTVVISLWIFSALPSYASSHESCEAGKSIYQIAENAGSFKTLISALEITGLDEVMKDDGNFTVFAPTDDAFQRLPPETLEFLINHPEELKKILLYHVAGKRLEAAQVVNSNEVDTLLEKILKVSLKEDGAFLNDSKIIATDIKACNGIIHVIDSVLVPNANTPSNDPKTVDFVDLFWYMGTWYEIARYDTFFQKDCKASRAKYSLKKDYVKVVNTCLTFSGKTRDVTGRATVEDQKSNAKLKVKFSPFGEGEYWILALGDFYQYALIGDSSRSNLFILSRFKTMNPKTYNKLLKIAEKEGFNTSKIKKSEIFR